MLLEATECDSLKIQQIYSHFKMLFLRSLNPVLRTAGSRAHPVFFSISVLNSENCTYYISWSMSGIVPIFRHREVSFYHCSFSNTWGEGFTLKEMKTYSIGLLGQGLCSFYCWCSHSFTLGNRPSLGKIYFNFLTPVVWNLSPWSLHPAVFVLTWGCKLIHLLLKTAFWIPDNRRMASFFLFYPPKLQVFRLIYHPGHFLWILQFYLGPNSTLQDNFNNRVRPRSLLTIFYFYQHSLRLKQHL